MKIHNFSAGPGILPVEVLQEAAQGVLNYQDTGLSLIEMSHRGPEFVDVMDQAVALVRDLYNLSNDYDVVFLQGGASLQFYMAPLNLLSSSGYAAYLDTGTWASNAIKEAKRVGRVEVIGSSKDKNYAYLPEFSVPADADYLHYTSNNTIFGTQFQSIPDSPVPLVCDMSSDIFSKPIDASRFSMNVVPSLPMLMLSSASLISTFPWFSKAFAPTLRLGLKTAETILRAGHTLARLEPISSRILAAPGLSLDTPSAVKDLVWQESHLTSAPRKPRLPLTAA